MSDHARKPRRLLDAVREAIAVRHYSYRTEQAYVYWVRYFIRFHNGQHPRELREPEVGAFLSWLTIERRVSPATQNQALNALAFLYRAVLDRPLADVPQIVRARKRIRLPTVLTLDEVAALLSHLDGVHWMVAALLYGSGLRLREAIGLSPDPSPIRTPSLVP